jgi:hypothetical protein
MTRLSNRTCRNSLKKLDFQLRWNDGVGKPADHPREWLADRSRLRRLARRLLQSVDPFTHRTPP